MNNKFSDKIRKSYNKIADIWHEKREWYIEQASIDEAIKYLPQHAKILDVGCGSGQPIGAYLIAHGFDVYGVDISPKLIDYAKQVIPADHLFVSDICDFTTPLTFDGIICWFTLFHIHADYHFEILKKFNSLLKPHGILSVTFADTSYKPVGADVVMIDEYTMESNMFGERFYHSGRPAAENTQLIKEAGFEIISDKIDQPGNQVILAVKK